MEDDGEDCERMIMILNGEALNKHTWIPHK